MRLLNLLGIFVFLFFVSFLILVISDPAVSAEVPEINSSAEAGPSTTQSMPDVELPMVRLTDAFAFSAYSDDIDKVWVVQERAGRHGAREVHYLEPTKNIVRAIEVYYHDGRTISERTLYSGSEASGRLVRDGTARTWHSNGRIASIIPYSEDVVNGRCQKWAEDGTPIADYTLRYGNGVIVEYYSSGSLKYKIPMSSGFKDGVCVDYFDGGVICNIVKYKMGDPVGPAISYFQNGAMKVFCYYQGGELSGPSIFFKEEGRISSVSYYLKGLKVPREEYVKASSIDSTLIQLPSSDEEYRKFPDLFKVE